MTADNISLAGGTLLSLFFSYIPGLQNRFNKFDGTRKRLVMLGVLVLFSASVFGLACLGWGEALGITLTCDQAGALSLVRSLIIAIIANQSIYSISPHKK